MFKTTLNYYGRAFALAPTKEKKLAILPYLQKAAMLKKPISQMEDADGKPIPLREETEEIKAQRKSIESALDLMCAAISEVEPIEGISSLKELDFRLLQELTYAGWIVNEREGKVVISAYMPVFHKKTA